MITGPGKEAHREEQKESDPYIVLEKVTRMTCEPYRHVAETCSGLGVDIGDVLDFEDWAEFLGIESGPRH